MTHSVQPETCLYTVCRESGATLHEPNPVPQPAVHPEAAIRPEPKRSSRAVFLSRLFSTIGLWVLLLFVIFSGNPVYFQLLIGALSLTGLYEFYTMLERKNLANFKLTGLVCGLVMLVGSFFYYRDRGPAGSYDFEVAVILVFIMTIFARQFFHITRTDLPLQTLAFTLFGLLYVVWMFNFTTKLVFLLPKGQFYVLYLIVITKFSDMGAYLTGSLIGRHPFMPSISPKKTWEGFFGALAFSMLGSFGMIWLMPQSLALITTPHAIVLGLLLGFTAVVGDLGESLVKRSTQTKDSGHFIPGIGGILDLIDSLLFTAPMMFFYMRLVMRVD